MEHNVPLISTLAMGFGLALVFGFIAERLRVPALLGYLVAGILIGPATPGFVADIAIAAQLSEIGVMLLMFGVGLHFSLKDLMSVKWVAIPGAIVQMTVATLMGMGVASLWGWSIGEALVLGISLSCASTVVLLKALETRGILVSMNGRIAVGWLVMEDLVIVLALVLMPSIAEVIKGPPGQDMSVIWYVIGETLLQVVAFILIMLFAGRRVIPWLMWQISRTGSRELFTLSVVAAALGIAFGAAKLFGVSFALGAFFAGMVMRESEFSQRAAEESLPLRDAFAVLFFVGVGMLFDPTVIWTEPLHLLAVVLIIMIGKSIAAFILVLLLRYTLTTALTVSASLAQIGELSFILVGLGISLGMLPQEGQSLVLSGAIISIALNPLMFKFVDPFRDWLLKTSALARNLEHRTVPFSQLPETTESAYLSGQVVLVGFAAVGKRMAEMLRQQSIPFVVIDHHRDVVENLREEGMAAVSGDAAEPAVLIQAHITNAAMLVISTPDPINVSRIIETAKTLNPQVEIVLNANTEEEARLFEEAGYGTVFVAERELGANMSRHVIDRFAVPSSSHS